MGTDITLHIEVKRFGKWHHYSCPYIIRWYDLFAKMAGVRAANGVKPIKLPVGIPEDITVITQVDWMEDNGQAASWLNWHEICELKKWVDKDNGANRFEDIFGQILWCDFDDRPGITYYFEDVRFVFWFDGR